MKQNCVLYECILEKYIQNMFLYNPPHRYTHCLHTYTQRFNPWSAIDTKSSQWSLQDTTV